MTHRRSVPAVLRARREWSPAERRREIATTRIGVFHHGMYGSKIELMGVVGCIFAFDSTRAALRHTGCGAGPQAPIEGR